MHLQSAKTESPKPLTIALCFLIQWTWGIFQNILGFLLFLAFLPKKHFRFRTSIITPWKIPYSVGCGMFIFLNSEEQDLYGPKAFPKWQYDTLVHEYGHSIQSMILGPLFLPVIAVPSVIWASIPYFQKLRNRKRISYYWLYCEKWANILGDKICHNKRPQY